MNNVDTKTKLDVLKLLQSLKYEDSNPLKKLQSDLMVESGGDPLPMERQSMGYDNAPQLQNIKKIMNPVNSIQEIPQISPPRPVEQPEPAMTPEIMQGLERDKQVLDEQEADPEQAKLIEMIRARLRS